MELQNVRRTMWRNWQISTIFQILSTTIRKFFVEDRENHFVMRRITSHILQSKNTDSSSPLSASPRLPSIPFPIPPPLLDASASNPRFLAALLLWILYFLMPPLGNTQCAVADVHAFCHHNLWRSMLFNKAILRPPYRRAYDTCFISTEKLQSKLCTNPINLAKFPSFSLLALVLMKAAKISPKFYKKKNVDSTRRLFAKQCR